LIMKLISILLIFLPYFLALLSQTNAVSCGDLINDQEPMNGGRLNYQSDPTVDYANSPSGPTLLDVLPKEKSLTIFTDLIYQSSVLVDLFSNPDLDPAVTFFAPTNSAMKRFLAANESNRVLLSDPERLNEFITLHLAIGRLDITSSGKAETLAASKQIDIVVEKDGKMVLNGRAIVGVDSVVRTANGDLYLVDDVFA